MVGVSSLDLCQKDCSWVESKVVDLFPYDAGTDNGISYMVIPSLCDYVLINKEKIYYLFTIHILQTSISQ